MMASSYKAARYAGTAVDYTRMADSLHFSTFKGHAEQLQALEKTLLDEIQAALKEQRNIDASNKTNGLCYDFPNYEIIAQQDLRELLASENRQLGTRPASDDLHAHVPLVKNNGSEKVKAKSRQARVLQAQIQQQHRDKITIRELRRHLLASNRTIDTLRSQIASHNCTHTDILKTKTPRHSDVDYQRSTEIMQRCENAFRAALKVFESSHDRM